MKFKLATNKDKGAVKAVMDLAFHDSHDFFSVAEFYFSRKTRVSTGW